VERSLLCTMHNLHMMTPRELSKSNGASRLNHVLTLDTTLCGTKTVFTECFILYAQSTPVPGYHHSSCSLTNQPTSIPLWLTLDAVSVSSLTLAPMLAQLQEMGARRGGEGNRDRAKTKTDAPLHSTTLRTQARMHALPLSFRVVLLHAKHRRQRAAKEAAAAAGAKQPRKQIGQRTDFTVNCLTAASHFCGSLSARGLLVAARLLAPRRSKERRFLRACQVRKSVRAGPLVNLERDRQSHSTTQPCC